MDGVRVGRETDFERVRAVEVAAGEAFREVGLGFVADFPAPPDEWLRGFGESFWVNEVGGVVAAYLVVEEVDGCAHIAQVSTDPAYRGRGLGAELIDHVDGWGPGAGFSALTLTTYRDVPWNAPYYARLGFRVVEATGGLARVVASEARIGLDPAARVCMRREFRSAP